MKKKIWLIGSILIIVLLAVWWFAFREESSASEALLISPKVGMFDIVITTTGELQAKNSLEIRGPEGVRQLGIW